MAILGGLAVGAAFALIYVLDKNRATLDAAIDHFGAVELGDLFVTQGNVTEGDLNDFTVVGTFGDVTRAQKIRSQPKPV